MLHPKKNIVMSVACQALAVVMNNHVDKQLIMMYKYNSCWHWHVVSVHSSRTALAIFVSFELFHTLAVSVCLLK